MHDSIETSSLSPVTRKAFLARGALTAVTTYSAALFGSPSSAVAATADAEVPVAALVLETAAASSTNRLAATDWPALAKQQLKADDDLRRAALKRLREARPSLTKQSASEANDVLADMLAPDRAKNRTISQATIFGEIAATNAAITSRPAEAATQTTSFETSVMSNASTADRRALLPGTPPAILRTGRIASAALSAATGLAVRDPEDIGSRVSLTVEL